MDVEARKKMNRLWLFFVLVCVALVWTWSQVGQQHAGSSLVDGEDIILLYTERDCDLVKGPCAAFLKEFAVVASARREADSVVWRIRLVGEGGPALPVVTLQLLGPRHDLQALEVQREAGQWTARMTRHVEPGSLLRVRIRGGELPLVADFPLLGDKDPKGQ